MLELEVVPERSLGNEQWEFVLGMALSHAVQILQQHANVLKNLQILYSDFNPLAMDLVINLTQDGIRLIFDPVVQRLKIIEVYNMPKVKLKYCGIPFNSPEIIPTVKQIDHSFGATHPGVYDKTQHVFALNFRGLSFSFLVDSKFQPQDGLPSLNCRPSNDERYPIVSKMSIYSGNNLGETKPPPLPVCCYYNHVYLENLDVIRENDSTVGIKLYLNAEGIGSSSFFEMTKQKLVREIKFGDSCQEVTGALGSPSKVFYKAEDKMKIHLPNAHKWVTTRSSDYFYNYFTLGLDILFDAKTHCVTKFILHTNYPGHYNFNTYFRCNFKIIIPRKNISPNDITEKPNHTVTAYTKWDTICDIVPPSIRPVVLNRASSTNAVNPYGPTHSYGYEDIIFEVMANNHIASITLYNLHDIEIPPAEK